MTDTSKFAILLNAGDWQKYKTDLVSSVLGGEAPDLFELNSFMGFPSDPKRYPCLVASLIVMLDGSASDEGKYQVNCCYVYPDDAKKLLDAATAKKKTISKPKVFAEAVAGPVDADAVTVTQLSAVLLALVSELESLGAIKQKRLLNEVKRLYKSFDGRDVSDFLSLLSETLEDRNAN